MLFLICLAIITGGTFASQSANQYVDNVIFTTLQNVIKSEKLDPTFLPDYTFEYKDKQFFVTVNGKAEYTKGSLSGLSKIVRVGDCQGPTNSSGSTYVNCTLAFSQLDTTYKGQVKYGVLPKVSITAKGNTSKIQIGVAIAKGFNDMQATVRSLFIRQSSTLETSFSGLGPLNKHMKVLEKNYKSQVTPYVLNVVLNRFKYALNLAVGQVPMPLR